MKDIWKETHPYLHEAAPDPIDRSVPVNLKTVMAYLATRGLICSHDSIYFLAPKRDSVPQAVFELAMFRYLMNFYSFSGDHNLYLALEELAKHDTEAADRIAQRVTASYEAGDSYGEWLWEWTTDQGIDAQRILDEHSKTPFADMTVTVGDEVWECRKKEDLRASEWRRVTDAPSAGDPS